MKAKKTFSQSGLTVIELFLVIAIIAVVAGIAVVNLFGRRGRTELDSTTRQIATLLREAQSRSLNQASSSAWGVHLENSTATNPFYALFASSYASATQSGYYRLPTSVRYATSSLSQGSSTEIVFSQVIGLPAASTSIKIESVPQGGIMGESSTIIVNTNGSIQY